MQKTATMTTHVCVIYRAGDGAIVHIHFEAFVPGMKVHSEERMEELARERAAAKQRDLTDVKFLHLRDPQFGRSPKRVDPRTGKIEFADAPSPGGASRPSQ